MHNQEVWQPDIVLYNRAIGERSASFNDYDSVQILVYPNGKVTWVPPSQFDAYCDIDLTHWPFDRQRCRLLIGSWVYDGNKLDLWPATTAIENEIRTKNSEWEITNLTWTRNVKMYDCCTEPYVNVEFVVSMERRANTYRAIVIAPAVAVVAMTLAVFLLPINSGQKILINVFNVVVVVTLLLYFVSKLGNMAASTPLIGKRV